jgi:hypothetical protein
MKREGWRRGSLRVERAVATDFQFSAVGVTPRTIASIKARAFSLLVVTVALAIPLIGCVSKKQADARAQAAFVAGEAQATVAARQAQIRGPTVTIIGTVRTPLVPWTADLTLAKALVTANYYGKTDPTEITIQRNGQEIQYDPKKLLGGEDVQLEPSDVIMLKQ